MIMTAHTMAMVADMMTMVADMMTMVADTVAMASSHVLKKLIYYGNGIMKSRSVICHVHWCIRSEV